VSDFRLPLTGGGEGSLGAALGGRRGAVVLFWSGVCSHCQRYDGYLNDFAARHPELALVVVAARQGESRRDLECTAAERGLRFPILCDAGLATAHAWRVEQTPRAFLVDGERRLLYRGAIDNFKYPSDPEHRPYLEAAIDDFLNHRPVARPETPSFGCAIESVYYEMPKPFGS
jgi:peroxiredoxin